MTNIIDIFSKESEQLIHYNFPELSNGFETCWYPSAHQDFLPINKFKKEKNVIFVYNDVLAINDMFNYDRPNPLFSPGKFHSRDLYKGDVEILWYWELNLKEICWNPNREILGISLPNKLPKVYLFKIKSSTDSKIIPLIYLSFENTNFFYDYILHYNIQIDTLIHINDGGASLGISNYKMDYIYLHVDQIGVKEIWVDYNFEDKKRHILKFSRFEHYSRPHLRVNNSDDPNQDYRSEQELRARLQELDYQMSVDRNFEKPKFDESIVERLFTDWQKIPTSSNIEGFHYVKKSFDGNLNLNEK